MCRSKPPRKPKINARNTKDPDLNQAFRFKFEKQHPSFEEEVTPDEMWNGLKNTIYDAASQAYGLKKTSKADWIEENAPMLVPLLEEKRKARLEHERNPSNSTKDKLRFAKAELQRTSRRCANDYWEKLCNEIQQAADIGDIRRMYDKIRVALGPQVSKIAPLKSTTGEEITDKSQQMERWIEHYSGLYSKDRTVDTSLEDMIPQLSELTELDNEPTEDELAEAIENLQSGKSPGSDQIPAEVLKDNKEFLLPFLHKLLITCWRKCEIPQDMRDATIVTLYKNKGDKGDCNNYRGISLLSITGKTFARVLLRRLQLLAERILPESQCGFRSSRSTIDMIFSLRQLQEKCQEQGVPLHMAFVDLTKAFDTVSRSGLYMVLQKIGCPPTLRQLIISFHEDMKGTVQFDGSLSDSFNIRGGVKQGCVLAPTLFAIFFAALLDFAFRTSPGDIFLHWRTDGSLFNISRLKAKTKISQSLIRDLLFADDAALVAHNETTLQIMIDHLAHACQVFSLTISVKKTVTLTQAGAPTANLTLDTNPLESVEKFCYLGSTIASSTSLDEDLNARIGKAGTSFGKLTKRAWNNKMLTLRTKIRVYEACILSTLLYGAETWTLYSSQEKRLNTFHLRCLRKIIGISWEDKKTNMEVLELAGLPSMFTILGKRRLRWLGHVRRMDDSRIPKQLLYGEMAQGTRQRGRPKLRFKDKCKTTLKKFNIDPSEFEDLAENRTAWKSTLTAGAKHNEDNIISTAAQKRQARKEKPPVPCGNSLICRFCCRACLSNIGRISHERSCRSKTNHNSC